MKSLITILAIALATVSFGQLNSTSLHVRESDPELFESIRFYAKSVEGDNVKGISSQINIQTTAFVQLTQEFDANDLEPIFKAMFENTLYQDLFNSYIENNEVNKCWYLPIDWYNARLYFLRSKI